DRSHVLHVLEGCELFNGLEKDNIEMMAGLCKDKKYRAGEYIFRQGDFGEYLYVIAEGNIILERSRALGTRKGSAVIGVLGKGRALGCWSTLLGESCNHMASAACQKPTEVVAIQGADLREMMVGSSEFGFRVLENLCFLLRDRIQGAYGAFERI
ncbi:MAG: cyclic nucleotide-binding domain-containing protein, partial [Desulfobacteraceae bacterium]